MMQLRCLWPWHIDELPVIAVDANEAARLIAGTSAFPLLADTEPLVAGLLGEVVRSHLAADGELAGLTAGAMPRIGLSRHLAPNRFTQEALRDRHGDEPAGGWYGDAAVQEGPVQALDRGRGWRNRGVLRQLAVRRRCLKPEPKLG